MISKTAAIIIASIIITAAAAGTAVYVYNASSGPEATVIDGGKSPSIQDTTDYTNIEVLSDLVAKLEKYGGSITTRGGEPIVYVNPQDEVNACQDVIIVTKLESNTSYFFDIHNIKTLKTNN